MTDTTHLDSVRAVLARHRGQIMQSYRAVGVGIGKQSPGDPSYVIVVYLESPRDQPQQEVSVEGVPVRFEVTGTIRPLDQGRR